MKKLSYWLFALLLPVVTLVVLLSFFSVDAPLSDDYDAVLAYLVKPFPERLLHLADFHNEHRIATARIVFESVYWIFGRINFRACMAVGATFLLGYGLLFHVVFRDAGNIAKMYYIPCIWAIVSVLNYDNVCWAMTSVSNIPVLFWTLSAIILFAKRNGNTPKRMGVAGGVVCAALATFSTGGGLFSWAGLYFVLFHERLVEKGGWGRAWVSRKDIRCLLSLDFLVVTTSFLLCASLYLVGVGEATSKEPTCIVNMTLFFLSFLGAIIPVFSVSVLIGVGVLCAIVYLVATLPRQRNTILLAFLLCLVLCVGAATPFRSSDVTAALPGRYRIIPISIAVSLFVAFLPQLRFKTQKAHLFCSVVLSCIVFAYLAAFSAVSLRSLNERNDIVRKMMARWNKDVSCIEIEKGNGRRFAALLREAVEKGVYNPGVVDDPHKITASSPVEKPVD
ncbi:MAG: hypothetical protein IJ658_13550 [Kiritimatiellae bacterium]|nr:hypothetical protein [Kiritimatiellia bacterium]